MDTRRESRHDFPKWTRVFEKPKFLVNSVSDQSYLCRFARRADTSLDGDFPHWTLCRRMPANYWADSTVIAITTGAVPSGPLTSLMPRNDSARPGTTLK